MVSVKNLAAALDAIRLSLAGSPKGDLEAAQQERNLAYVASTRAKFNLFFISTNREQL